MFALAPAARSRYPLTVVNATGDGFIERVTCLNKRYGLVSAGRKTLREVPKGDDDLA